ncbi:DUF2793 domain-containing protein [uncultured Sphingomonas sp.]|uniref:DUF2793 domain-containing protein n=1 Tax=uncultured Sphingomonas sp. TaxID=158754 RepID=UPI0025DFA6DC|nr:DUF2793 domain-containing protein [uncultured Sphingomonas sp.]
MAEEQTDRHGLPLLQAGQAQKELTHNEALVLVDMLAMASVLGVRDTVPTTPAPGDCWIVGPAPAGEWAGAAGKLACWTASGWRFAPPRDGMRVWRADEGVDALWQGGGWTTGMVAARRIVVGGEPVVGARQPAIDSPEGGGTVDVEARVAIGRIIAAMAAHGLVAPS